MPFDPTQPFDVVDEKPKFDPSQPFESVAEQPNTPASTTEEQFSGDPTQTIQQFEQTPASREANQFVQGLNLKTVPLDALQSLTPLIGAYQGIKQGYEVATGTPVEKAVPESQTLVGIEQKPLQERLATGINTVLPLLFGKAITEGIPKLETPTTLTDTLFPKAPEPATELANIEQQAPVAEAQALGEVKTEVPPETVAAEIQPTEGQSNAIQPSTTQVQGGETALGVEEGAKGAVPPTSDSDNVIREAQGTETGGQVPQRGEPSQAEVGTPAEKVPFVEGSPSVAGEVAPEQAAASKRIIPVPTEPIAVKPLVALRATYQAAEKAGTAGYKRGLSEGIDEGRVAIAQIKGELSMADRWMAGDQEQVRQNMVEFVQKTLPPDERGRYIGAITRALKRPPLQAGEVRSDPGIMYKNAFRVMQAIQNRSEVVYKGNLIDDIKATVAKSAESPSVDVAYRRKLADLMSGFSETKPTAATTSKLQSLQDYVTRERAAGREPNVPQEQLDQLSRLHQLPLKDMDVNSVERLKDRVDSLVGLGKLKADLLQRSWDKQKQSMLTEMQKQPSAPIESRPMNVPQPTETLTTGQKFMNGVRTALNAGQTFKDAIAPMDEIYDRLGAGNGSYGSWPSRFIKGNLDLGENHKLSELIPIRDASSAIIKRYGLTGTDMQTVGVKGVLNMIGRDRLEAMGVRGDILDRVESTPLTKGQQAYYDFTRQHYDALGSRVQDVAHRLYQQDMDIVDNYVPLIRDWAAHSETAPPSPQVDPLGGEIPFNETATMDQLRRDFNPKILSRTEQGFLKDRIEGAKTAVQLNAEDVFLRHTQDALHFIHQQPVVKMLGEVVRTPDFAAKYGKLGQNIVLDNLDTVASQGYVNHNQRVPFIDWVRNSTSKGAVGFRIASNIVHSSQIGFEANHAGGPGWWAKGLKTALTPEGQAFLRQNAPETYFRGGGEPAQADVEAISKIGRAGFFVARNIDKLGAQATFLGRYMKEMSKAGVPVDDVLNSPVNPDIQALALQRMHRAVASPMAKDVPQMTSRGKAVGGNVSVARAINQFRNIFLDNWSNVQHDFLRVGVNQASQVIKHLQDGEYAAGAKLVGDAVSHRAAIAGAALIGLAMETGIKMGVKEGTRAGMTALTGVEEKKRKDEPTYLQEFRRHALNRVPLVGQVSSALLYGETGIPMIDSVVNPIKEVGQALIYSKKPETQAKHLIRAGSAAATVAGIPGSSQVLELAQPALSHQLGKVLPDRSKTKTRKNAAGRVSEFTFRP